MTQSSSLSIWVITTDRRGDIVQCEAIARHLSNDIRFIEVKPRQPWAFFMPWGPADPQELPSIAPPFPDLVIAANRRAYPYAKHVHRQAAGKTKIIFMKPPGRDVSSFAYLWAPAHDRLSGKHVITTLTAPHLITPDTLDECQKQPDPRLADLNGPKLAVILGGNNKHVTYDGPAISAFIDKLKAASGFDSIMVTPSRRTPDGLLDAIKQANPCNQSFIWDGVGENPYFAILAEADAILVTGDSHNMVGEALAAGKPVHVVEPPNNPVKFNWTINELRKQNLIAPKDAALVPGLQKAFNETPLLVASIKKMCGS